MDDLDERAQVLDFYRNVWPDIVKAAKVGDIEAMFRGYGVGAVLELGKQMRHGKTEKTRQDAARTLMHMHTGTPVQRSLNINRNFDTMADKELDVLLLSKLKRSGLLPGGTGGENGGATAE